MKKAIQRIGLMVVFLLGLNSSFAIADSTTTIKIDGDEVKNVKSIIYNNRLYVPVRGIFQYFGADVIWDPISKCIQIKEGNTWIELYINIKTVKTNNYAKEIDSPPIIINNIAYIPLRAAIECLDANVEWDAETNTANITLNNAHIMYLVDISILGGKTVSDEQLRDVLRNPEKLKQKVKTLNDVVAYFRLSGFKPDYYGTYKIGQWHYNRPAEDTIRVNMGNCGATASVIHYLLEDDYEEVGFIHFLRRDGGHVFNYVKRNGYYYVFDYSGGKGRSSITKVRNLTDYANYYQSRDSRIQLMTSFLATNCLPVSVDKQNELLLRYPQGSQVSIIYDNLADDARIGYLNHPNVNINWEHVETRAQPRD